MEISDVDVVQFFFPRMVAILLLMPKEKKREIIGICWKAAEPKKTLAQQLTKKCTKMRG